MKHVLGVGCCENDTVLAQQNRLHAVLEDACANAVVQRSKRVVEKNNTRLPAVGILSSVPE